MNKIYRLLSLFNDIKAVKNGKVMQRQVRKKSFKSLSKFFK